MKNEEFRICPHCGAESISLEKLEKANWDQPCKCPSCEECCNSRRFYVFLLSTMVYIAIDPLIIIFGSILYGWQIAIPTALFVALAGYLSAKIIVCKLQPIKVICR